MFSFLGMRLPKKKKNDNSELWTIEIAVKRMSNKNVGLSGLTLFYVEFVCDLHCTIV